MTFNQEQDYWAGYKVVFEFGIGEAVPLSVEAQERRERMKKQFAD